MRPKQPDIMLREYCTRPDATIAAFRNLWFHTGDRARMDADGFFYYVDRLTDSIRRRGENVSSFEVEAVVTRSARVVECGRLRRPVRARRGRGDGRRSCSTGRRRTRLAALVAHCEERWRYFAVPRYLRIVDALPKTPSQRVQKFKLREQGVTEDTVDRGERPSARP